jgi:ATP-dependent Lhr-like helicase
LFGFTAAFMYQYDATEAEPNRTTPLDRQLLEQLTAPERQAHLLDPRAIHQVERRLRGLGQPPRSVTEMAEWLRRLGDLTSGELEGPMAGFVEELAVDGRAHSLELPRCREPRRWVLAEDESLYRSAFGLEDGDASQAQEAGEAILARFLDTHALVGLRDVLDRYPFEPDWARRKLEEWASSRRIVAVRTGPESEPLQWSAPTNLDQVQRTSLGLLRREILTCQPPQFVDFVLRWQGLHPATRHGGPDGLVEVLARLEGLPLPLGLWERTILPARVPGYQPRWLDESVAGGEWAWVCQGDGDSGAELLAFWGRERLLELPPPAPPASPLDTAAERVLEALRGRGACFVTDLAQQTGLAPSALRAALWQLLRQRLATNDRFDVVRKGEETAARGEDGPARHSLSALRRRGVQRPEGRWSLVPWGRPEAGTHALQLAAILLQRYGVVARELALLDPCMLPWRVLYEVFSRMELAGEVRRGYFVEGISGAQFALPEAARLLQELDLPSTAAAPVLLLHSQDPANLYGSGAPLDVPMLDGGTRSFARRAGNWLVLRGGRPVLLIEQKGRQLTTLASASRADVADAVACLPGILDQDVGRATRHKLTVEQWNGQPVTTTEGRELLESTGFVRDYQGMTLYVAWR